jgi:hypothetical protein
MSTSAIDLKTLNMYVVNKAKSPDNTVYMHRLYRIYLPQPDPASAGNYADLAGTARALDTYRWGPQQ